MCNGGLFLFCVTVTQKTENAKFTGKELTKQIFPDILIKVGLKSHEKSEKTRYYFVLLSEQEKKFRIIIRNTMARVQTQPDLPGKVCGKKEEHQ